MTLNMIKKKNIWIIEVAINKPDGLRKKDMRQDLYVTVYDGAGNIHSTLEFTDTRNGDFFTQWRAPTEPGLYVVMLQYMNSKATQIVNVADKSERSYDSEELDTLELAISSCPQSFPASGSFPKSQLFASDGQGIGASASASAFLMNIQGRFPLRWTGLISLQSKGLSSTTVQKHQLFVTQPSLWSSSHIRT